MQNKQVQNHSDKCLRATAFVLLALVLGNATAPLASAYTRSSRHRHRERSHSQEKTRVQEVRSVKVASPQEAKDRLKEIKREKELAQERVRLAREQEKKAYQKLRNIQSNLNETTKELSTNKHQLEKTESHLVHVETNIKTTVTQEHSHEDQAAARLREMYEGQRLGLLDMLFQVGSLQQLMDLLYYQERVAELDRKLLDQLRAKAQALSAQKTKLGQQRMQLGDIVSEFAKKALMLNKEKSEQEVVAEKLRSTRAFYEAAEQQLSRESGQLEQQILQMVRATNKTNPDKVVTHGSGTMSLPIHAPVTSPFGWRRHPIFGMRKFHTGVDLAGPNHTPIKAADSGNVLYSGWYGGYGKVVIVNHGNGLATLYAHMSKTVANPGDNINKGDVVGYEGTTGFSTGPHLHFEVRVDGKPNNPLNYAR